VSDVELKVRGAAGADDVAWDRYVRGHALGTVFHLRGWGRATHDAFGAIGRDFIAVEAGEVVGVLPLSACRRVYKRRTLISAPWGVYGDPLGDRPEVVRALVDAALEAARSDGVPRVELRCRRDPGLDDFIASDLYASFTKELPDDPDAVLAGYKKKERQYIRYAEERHGLRFEEGAAYMGTLQRLFLASKRALGSPGLSRAWWRALEEHLGSEFTVHAALKGEEVVAASLSFHNDCEAAMFYIGTAPTGNREYQATKFMIAKCSEWAVREGYRTFDLGRSRRGTGAAAFKGHQGFEESVLHYRYALLDESAKVPSFNPSNPKTDFARKVWSKLPLWTCDVLTGQVGRFLA
jgi:FemAB-related protein (PEP-CTERM system-associated)